MSQEEKKKLQDQYKELYGKGAFQGWDVPKLKELIAEKTPVARFGEEVKEVDESYIGTMKIDHKKVYQFKQIGKKEGTSFLPRTAKVWCEHQNKLREIRYCKTESSPYVDEQSPEAVAERLPLTFNDGELTLDGSNQAGIKFLLAWDAIDGKKRVLPQNEGIRSKYFLVDTDADVRKSLDRQKAQLRAKNLISEAKLSDLTDFIRSVFRRSFEKENELLDYAFSQATDRYDVFLNEFTNPIHALKSKIQVSFQDGVLSSTNGVIKIKETGGVVLTIDPKDKVREDEALARWILVGSKEAKEFKEYLDTKQK